MPMEFDAFYIKHGGLSDDGEIDSAVIIGFSEPGTLSRSDITIPVTLPANIEETVAKLRERAADQAFVLLKQAVDLLKSHSPEELHQIAVERASNRSAKASEDMQQSLTAAFTKPS